MKDLLLMLAHMLATLARLLGPGGAKVTLPTSAGMPSNRAAVPAKT